MWLLYKTLIALSQHKYEGGFCIRIRPRTNNLGLFIIFIHHKRGT